LRRTKYLDEGSVYATDVSTMLEHLDRNERDGIAPETVAATIVDAVISPRPRELYAVGSRAPLPFLLKRILPRGLMSKIVAAQHGLRRCVRGRRGGNPRSQRPRPAGPTAARPSAAGPGIRLLEPGGDEVLGRRDAEHPLLA